MAYDPIANLREEIDQQVFDIHLASTERRRQLDAQILPPTAPKIESNFSAHPNVPFRTPDMVKKQPAQIGGSGVCPTATPVIQAFEDITLADGSGIPAVLEVEMGSTDWVAV